MAGCFRQGGRLPARDDSDAPKQSFVIGVTGGTTSGKTTVCDMIVQQLHYHRIVLVNQDSFYLGLNAEELELVHEYNFDHPDAFDMEQLLECAEKLRAGQPGQIPIYDFKTHQRRTDTFRQGTFPEVYCSVKPKLSASCCACSVFVFRHLRSFHLL